VDPGAAHGPRASGIRLARPRRGGARPRGEHGVAAVWAKVAAVAPTKAWLSSAESSFSTESNNSEKKELQALKTEVQTALAALKKAQATPKAPYKPPGTPAAAPEDLRKTVDEKKAAKKAKKARQAARKAAREAGETVGADTADEAEDE
jgi:predicted acylesterase/phospholipase RssA